jgi:hypothetical protein
VSISKDVKKFAHEFYPEAEKSVEEIINQFIQEALLTYKDQLVREIEEYKRRWAVTYDAWGRTDCGAHKKINQSLDQVISIIRGEKE